MSHTDHGRTTGGGLAALRAGGKRALAEALALIERAGGEAEVAALIDEAFLAPRAHVIGFTGPPGVGKSTLIDALVRSWRASGVTVGVIAVDPSSQITRGALLGDRIRMRTDPEDQGVFVRSLASRGRLGGLSELAFPAVVLMRAIYDRVVVETVGVGQSEAEISAVADSVVLCVQPGSGDSLQFMKAGIMEIPDIAVVTKSDMGPPARRALADLKGALGLASGGGEVAALMLSVPKGEGLAELAAALDARFAAGGEADWTTRRHAQAESWLRTSLLHRFGEEGVAAAGAAARLAPGAAPFGLRQALADRLRVIYQG
ncbi:MULTISPECIES: methylmalonyl Co-A mutase-associated GTPase MeaB [Rhodomicrobium]|uniref:ArgK/MeaB family GTPase n=1 Tax=Rhodomicrobium TaxID=1068 RepID=UPI000B4A85A8|nr:MULTISPECIES: methylmalonyl Co-A mutase-associated GTPase MeaB [Rhodomicrobium]